MIPQIHQHFIYQATVWWTAHDILGKYDHESSLKQFLRELTIHIDMKMLIEPRVAYSKHNARTGLIGIVTSHISFHRRTEWNDTQWPLIQFDIYSCKPFSEKRATDFLNNFWKVTDHSVVSLNRNHNQWFSLTHS